MVIYEVLSWYIPGVTEENSKRIFKKYVRGPCASVQFHETSLYRHDTLVFYIRFVYLLTFSSYTFLLLRTVMSSLRMAVTIEMCRRKI